MAVTLAANVYPQGTQVGSPIKVVDTYAMNGGTEFTAGIPVSEKAKAGDVIWAFMGFTTSGTGAVGTITSTPSGYFTAGSANFAFNGGGGMAQISSFYRVVQADQEAGQVVGIVWPASLNQLGWGAIVYTLRHVDTSVIFDGSEVFSTSGTTPSLNTATGSIVTSNNHCLVLGALCAEGGPVGTGLGAPPLPGWRSSVQTQGGQQPNFGFISGMMDMPFAGTYLGAGGQFISGSTAVNTNWVGTLLGFKPTPSPAVSSFYLNPAAGAMDAADVAGRPLTAYWGYTPVSGQGKQLSWLFVRQTTGGSITQFWNGDINGWVNSEYWNYAPADQRSFTFPSGAWLNDSTQWNTWMAITEDVLFLKSPLAGPITFTTLAPPAVTGVTVTNPGTTTPTINWTEALTNSPQVAYRARVFSSDQLALPGFDPSNILVDDDSDFELSTGTWASLNATVQHGASHNFTGGGDLFIQATGTTGLSALSGSYPVTPGVAYRASAYTWADATPRAMTLGISWQDANGNQLSVTNGTPVTDSTTVWNQVTAAGTAPTGAVTARVTIKNTASAVNEVHRLDQVHFSATPVPKWFSGVVLSTALSATTAALAPSVQYTAYVEVLQTNDQWSPPLPFVNGAFVNANTATWFAGLTAAPVPAPAALTAVVGG